MYVSTPYFLYNICQMLEAVTVSVVLTVSFMVTAAVIQTAPRPVSNDVNKNFTNCIDFVTAWSVYMLRI